MLKGGVLLLLIHFYINCYAFFVLLHLTHPAIENLLLRWSMTNYFEGRFSPKFLPLVLLIAVQIGSKGPKNEKIDLWRELTLIAVGLWLYFVDINYVVRIFDIFYGDIAYMSITLVGFLVVMRGLARLQRIVWNKRKWDVFNQLGESFPQQQKLIKNNYSINLPAIYHLKGRLHKSWINIINPFRGILVAGTPGSGKSYFVVEHIIRQHIQKGFTMFVYDFKFDALSIIAYNEYLRNKHKYEIPPKFHVIDFDNLNISSRCNPLDPDLMTDITDAMEAARIIMLGLNRQWILKQGEFFVESPISFLTAIIWFLKKYEGGKYCTLPHAMELINVDYEKLFSILKTEPEIWILIDPFVSAYVNGAVKQLEGQIGSAKIALARLCSPKLYYILSGNELKLDINNPQAPKIVCVGNNPMKQLAYGAVLSLYTSRMVRLVNRRGQLPSSLIFDEFPTIYFNGMDGLMATGRSNRVSCTICVQDFAQLRKDYGKEQADVIAGVAGNVIAGQVAGETARLLSDRFGKINQEKDSVSTNSSDRSVTQGYQLADAVPAAKISQLSSGEMVGIVADTPDQPIKLKTFHAQIQNNRRKLDKQKAGYVPIPEIREVSEADVNRNFIRIQRDVREMVNSVWVKMSESPDLANLIVKKKGMMEM